MNPLICPLFVPTTDERKVARSLETAEAVIFDLEDAVAENEKPGARRILPEILSRPRRCRAFIRVNSVGTEHMLWDLLEAAAPGLDGIILPKLEGQEQVFLTDWLLDRVESARGLPKRKIGVVAIVETAKGFRDLPAIDFTGSRIVQLALGWEDLKNDLGLNDPPADLIDQFRVQIITQSRAAGLAPPLDGVHTDPRDEEGLKKVVRHIRSLGFGGKLCIHPAQIETVRRGLVPDEASLDWARRVVEGFERAEAEGMAAFTLDGHLIDYPIYYRAQSILRRSAELTAAE